ncbi:MAG TPA: response regulator [Thiolinea sp.]|nr:response regulator [Thiolinea sp.]
MQTADELAHYSIPGLDLQAGLQRAGNAPDAYLRFLHSVHEHGRHYRNNLQQALVEQDNSRLHQQLHGLRGVAATLGAVSLARSCSRLLEEKTISLGEIPPQLISSVFHELDRLLAGIGQSGILTHKPVIQAPQNLQAGPLQAFTLVFIEDDAALSQVFLGELKKHFGAVVWLGKKQEALDYLIRQETFTRSIILCDVQLPDGSGLDVARAISRREPDTLILLTSGAAIPAEDLSGIENSIQLLKPFSVMDILNLAKGLAFNLLGQKTA